MSKTGFFATEAHLSYIKSYGAFMSAGIITAGWRAGWQGLISNLSLTAGRPVTPRPKRRVKVTNTVIQTYFFFLETSDQSGLALMFSTYPRCLLLRTRSSQGHQGRRAHLQVWRPVCFCWSQCRRRHFHEEKRRQHFKCHHIYCGGSEDQHQERRQWRQRRHHSSLQVPWR